MLKRFGRGGTAATVAVLAAVLAAVFGATSLGASGDNTYTIHNLVGDVPGAADQTDPDLVNAWGLTRSAGSPWWVADNGTDKSTLYNGAGTKQGLVVTVPGGPTGAQVNLLGSGFVVSSGGASASARFLFSNEDGEIRGWNPNVPAPGSTQAVLATSVPGAIFKGLTMLGDRLYATDFHNGRVIVFDSSFNQVATLGSFRDPFLPPGYSPFGIQAIGDRIFVTYAKPDEEGKDDLHGTGLGIVDQFNTDGWLTGRVGTQRRLNAPWGLARAPDTGFGPYSGDLLVGNFGDGRISGFRPDDRCAWTATPGRATSSTPCFVDEGPLRDKGNFFLKVDGLWGMGFGAGNTNSGPATTLFFAAGPGDEEHGRFGTVTYIG